MADPCERCGKKNPKYLRMSFFNTEMLCPDCIEKEQKHPDYEHAKEVERQQVLAGNLNFPGIGKPSDL